MTALVEKCFDQTFDLPWAFNGISYRAPKDLINGLAVAMERKVALSNVQLFGCGAAAIRPLKPLLERRNGSDPIC
jgi:hypothetical protein